MSAKQWVATGLIAAVCGFGGSAVGLIVLHDQFRGEMGSTGPTGPQGVDGPAGIPGPRGAPGQGIDLLVGSYVVGDQTFGCPAGTTSPAYPFGEAVITVPANTIGNPLNSPFVKTSRLCEISIR